MSVIMVLRVAMLQISFCMAGQWVTMVLRVAMLQISFCMATEVTLLLLQCIYIV